MGLNLLKLLIRYYPVKSTLFIPETKIISTDSMAMVSAKPNRNFRYERSVSLYQFLGLVLLLIVAAKDLPAKQPASSRPFLPSEELLQSPPLAGQGFRTRFLGREVTAPTVNRRAMNAWVVGSTLNFPAPSGRRTEPFGALYFWRRPDQDTLFYADIALVYNHLLFAQSFQSGQPWEWVTTFENYTLPYLKQTELIEGRQQRAAEVEWGYVRPGVGIGYRKPVAPFQPDNMLALDLIVEPGLLYFGRHSREQGFITPDDTFELRTRMQFRWDALTRNFLNLVDRGFALGSDWVWGHRSRWHNWGIGGQQQGHNNYTLVSAYAIGATDLAFSGSGRHRLIGALFGAIGHHMDRFNRGVTQRLGGGVNPVGEEFHTLGNPVLPGAAYLEFFPEHYLLAYGEYRFATTFFAHLHGYGGAAYLNPRRFKNGVVQRQDTLMPFVGARLTSGLPGKLRLVVDYAHNFGLQRRQQGSGNQITLWISRIF